MLASAVTTQARQSGVPRSRWETSLEGCVQMRPVRGLPGLGPWSPAVCSLHSGAAVHRRSVGHPSCSPRQDRVGSEAVGTGRALEQHGRIERKEEGGLPMLGFASGSLPSSEQAGMAKSPWTCWLSVLGIHLTSPQSLGWLSLMGEQFLMVSDFRVEVSKENSPTLLGAA